MSGFGISGLVMGLANSQEPSAPTLKSRTTDDYIDWLGVNYPDNSFTGTYGSEDRNGGMDWNENQLEALKSASQIGPGGFIGLGTDSGFHYWGDNDDPDSGDHSYNEPPLSDDCIYTHLTAQQTHDLLGSAGCRVYIDAGNTYAADHYITPNPILHVSGAMEDTSYGTYTFPKMETAILGE